MDKFSTTLNNYGGWDLLGDKRYGIADDLKHQATVRDNNLEQARHIFNDQHLYNNYLTDTFDNKFANQTYSIPEFIKYDNLRDEYRMAEEDPLLMYILQQNMQKGFTGPIGSDSYYEEYYPEIGNQSGADYVEFMDKYYPDAETLVLEANEPGSYLSNDEDFNAYIDNIDSALKLSDHLRKYNPYVKK